MKIMRENFEKKFLNLTKFKKKKKGRNFENILTECENTLLMTFWMTSGGIRKRK